MAIAGDWKITIATPMGPQEADLAIKPAGDAFTGSIGGGMIEARDIAGTIDGETASFSLDITQPMPLTIDVKVTANGDALEGAAKLGMFGDAKVSGQRA
ncbi:hypothetical protein [Phenylobacterium immobile]|uniref:hypothetical protein n=1 Tax=Phenylobacterium immobile TaxID=21 RepID=UPI000AD70659|nr:hypothetical protein [Phenylobacterium immobile]